MAPISVLEQMPTS